MNRLTLYIQTYTLNFSIHKILIHQSIPAGFNPMWNERFQFNIQVPDLAMMQFVVEDYDSTSQNDLIGQYCLPITSVQNGKKESGNSGRRWSCVVHLYIQSMLLLSYPILLSFI